MRTCGCSYEGKRRQLTSSLYDSGLVARVESVPGIFLSVKPVSILATKVMQKVMSPYASQIIPSKSSYGINMGAYGLAIEDRVLTTMSLQNVLASSISFDGKPSTAIKIRSDFVLIRNLENLNETSTFPSRSVMFRPDDPLYAADAIIVSEDMQDPILIVEVSVTDPRITSRVDKVYKWFNEGGLIEKLKQVHHYRGLTIVLCYDKELKIQQYLLKTASYAILQQAANNQGVKLCLFSRKELIELGVRFRD